MAEKLELGSWQSGENQERAAVGESTHQTEGPLEAGGLWMEAVNPGKLGVLPLCGAQVRWDEAFSPHTEPSFT